MNQLTERQIAWAKAHDWFAGMVGECIEVVDRYTLRDGSYHETMIVWTKSFAELRNFAGY
jgi:hypothetical protein